MKSVEERKTTKPRFLAAGVFAYLFLLVAFLIRNSLLVRSGTSPKNTCINHLRQLDGAKHQWALEHETEVGNDVPTWNDVTPYLGGWIYCPQDTTRKFSNSYVLGGLKTPPQCKINSNHILP
jgi:hypothetical protein